jgi:hypothetical protein
VSAGIGSLVLGVLTTGAVLSEGLREALTMSEAVGPLSGKTTHAVLVWLVSWLGLHLAWRKRDIDTRAASLACLVLVALGIVFTFPPVFEAFE